MKNMIGECEGGRMVSHGGRCCGMMAIMDRAWGKCGSCRCGGRAVAEALPSWLVNWSQSLNQT